MSDPAPFHLGIDLSTTTARCVVLDHALKEVGFGASPHSDLHHSLAQDSKSWLANLTIAFLAAITSASIDPTQIGSVGIATQGVTTLAVNDRGEPVDTPLAWVDSNQPSGLFNVDKADWYQLSGRFVIGPLLATKLLSGNDLETSVRWALPGDFLTYHITGEWVLGPCLASTTGLVDPASRDWSSELLNRVGMTREKLSSIGDVGESAGVDARGPLATQLGLAPSTPVAFPTQDQRAAVLMADPKGEACTVTFGTAAAVVHPVETGRERIPYVPVTPGLSKDAWWLEGVVLAAGLAFDWGARLLGCPSTGAFLDLANTVPAGGAVVEFEPGITGVGSPEWNLETLASLTNLSLTSNREHTARAIVDSICRQVLENVAVVNDGQADVRLVGKAVHHRAVSHTLVEMLDEDVRVLSLDEPTAHGAAIIGAHAAGFLESLESGVSAALSHVVRPLRRVNRGDP